MLTHRDLRLLFGGLLISSTGTWAYNVAVLAFVFERTHSLAWIGAAGLVRLAPQMLLSVYGGVVAERTDRIRLMMGSDLLCAVWQTAITVVAATHGAPVLALVFVALTSASAAAYQPATAATLPSLADEDGGEHRAARPTARATHGGLCDRIRRPAHVHHLGRRWRTLTHGHDLRLVSAAFLRGEDIACHRLSSNS